MKRPISITVIAVLFFLGAAIEIETLVFHAVRFHFIPLFGVYLYGWAAFCVYVVFIQIRLIVGVGLLQREPWARTFAIALYIYGILNALLTWALPGRFDRYVQALKISHHMVRYSGSNPTISVRFLFLIEVFLGIPVSCVFIYFLWTRRSAFYPLPPMPPTAEAGVQSGE